MEVLVAHGCSKAPESGVDPAAGLAEALKLLRSASRATEGLVAEIQSCFESPHKWMLDYKVAAELQEIMTSMVRIWGVLLDAEDKALALQARDVIFGIQNVEDMAEYRRLKSELAPRSKVGRNPLLSALVIWKRLFACHGSSTSKPNKLREYISVLTRESRKLVQLLVKGTILSSSNPGLLLGSPGSDMEARQTDDIVLPKHKVFGRHKERDDILRMLTEPCGQPEPIVIPIVGIGGVGKTTLAQLVYNHTSVQQHFDVTSWVFVSSRFNKVELAARILRSAQPPWGGSEEMVDFEMLQSELRRFVASKRCLIVLDDVWADNVNDAWQDILTPLRSADTGSRILVTTRLDTVPHMLGASQVYPLNPLESDDCWALIKQHAFRRDSIDDYPDLQPIGREIAAKINGSPLAARMLGGVLGATRSRKHWMNIMDTGIQDDSVLPALRLSYSYLPGHLKLCFAYCSLFPKDWKLDPPYLSRLWIAQGFVQPRSEAEIRMEDTAREYFDQLLSRSFQEINLGSKTYYFMHTLLHDLAESVAAKDCFRIEQGMNCHSPSTVRHLSVTMNNLHGLTSLHGIQSAKPTNRSGVLMEDLVAHGRSKAPESGVDPAAGLAEAPKLLRSASRATEGLVTEIQSCFESPHKWMLDNKVAAELQEIRTSMVRIWGVLLDAEDKALALQAQDVIFGIQNVEDMAEYRRLPQAQQQQIPAIAAPQLPLEQPRPRIRSILDANQVKAATDAISVSIKDKIKPINPALRPPQADSSNSDGNCSGSSDDERIPKDEYFQYPSVEKLEAGDVRLIVRNSMEQLQEMLLGMPEAGRVEMLRRAFREADGLCRLSDVLENPWILYAEAFADPSELNKESTRNWVMKFKITTTLLCLIWRELDGQNWQLCQELKEECFAEVAGQSVEKLLEVAHSFTDARWSAGHILQMLPVFDALVDVLSNIRCLPCSRSESSPNKVADIFCDMVNSFKQILETTNDMRRSKESTIHPATVFLIQALEFFYRNRDMLQSIFAPGDYTNDLPSGVIDCWFSKLEEDAERIFRGEKGSAVHIPLE